MIFIENIFKKIVNYALFKNCTDLHLDFNEKYECKISVRYLGKINVLSILEKDVGYKLLNYILFKGNFDIIDNQSLHTNVINYIKDEKEFFLRLSVVFTYSSKSIVIRILNNHKKIDLNNLTFIKNNINILNNILHYKNGLVIFSGKTGSGKTTTMYAIIEQLLKAKKIKIISLEDPIERKINNVFQINVNKEIHSYFDVLKQVLRHDPDVIVVGEIRDENDLKLTIQAALSGHLVITSIHSISALFVINRLIDFNISISDLKACIRLISYQELFYTKNKKPFCIYEFITSSDVNKYFDNKKIKYTKIIDYVTLMRKNSIFYESK